MKKLLLIVKALSIFIMLTILLASSCVDEKITVSFSQDEIETQLMISSWEDAYRNFLFSGAINESDFLPKEILLIDLNFDSQPELAILHDSNGSLGSYYLFYYYDGFEVKNIINNENEAFRCTSNAQIYFEIEKEQLIVYKEMSGFLGNHELTYGYVREIIDKKGIPFVNNIIRVKQNDTLNYNDMLEKVLNANKENEAAVLANEELIIAEEYHGGIWHQIEGKEYIEQRNQLFDPDRQYVNYLDKAFRVTLSDFYEKIYDGEVIPYQDEVDYLFLLWDNK